MQIRRIFHTLDELNRQFGGRFCGRLKRLLCAYRRRFGVVDMAMAMRAASVAWAFTALAHGGDVARAEQFDDMLHGLTPERIELDDRPLLYDPDVPSAEEQIVWDIACLMLEEYEAGCDMPQRAYDIAGLHVLYAYRDEVLCDPTPPAPPPPPRRRPSVVTPSAPVTATRPASEPTYTLTQSQLDELARLQQTKALADLILTAIRQGDPNVPQILNHTKLMNEENTPSFPNVSTYIKVEAGAQYQPNFEAGATNIQVQNVYQRPAQNPERPQLDPNQLQAPLNAPKAMALWQKYYDEGFIDHEFHTLRSRGESALMATTMADVLGLKEYWSMFEQLFEMSNLRTAAGKALETQSGWDFKERLQALV